MRSRILRPVIIAALFTSSVKSWQFDWEYPEQMPHLQEFLESPENREKAVQSLEYGLEAVKRSTKFMSLFSNDVTCEACQDFLKPIDGVLNNLEIRKVAEEVITEICIELKIQGGEKAVC